MKATGELARFLLKLERSAIRPLALAGATDVRLGGWGLAGRPEVITSLSILCQQCGRPAAVIEINTAPCEVTHEVLLEQLLDTAGSLDPARPSRAGRGGRHQSTISVDIATKAPAVAHEARPTPDRAPITAIAGSDQRVSITIDGIPCRAEVKVQKDLAAIFVSPDPQGGEVLVATAGLDVSDVLLTSDRDWSAVWRATLEPPSS